MCVWACVLRAPAEVLWVDVQYSCSGHSSWSSSFQMRYLKEEAHGVGQADPLITGESQYLNKERGESVQLGMLGCEERILQERRVSKRFLKIERCSGSIQSLVQPT